MKQFAMNDGGQMTIDGLFGQMVYLDRASKKNVTLQMDGTIVRAIADGILDANGAFFFQRQLEHVKAKSYDVLYAELKARDIFPVSNEAGDGITTIVYRIYDQTGSAEIVNAYAQDLPRADVAGEEVQIPVRTVTTSYGYNIDEIKAAEVTGAPLDQRKANAAQRANEQKVNDVAFYGSPEHGLPGFFTNPNIPTGAVADGASAAKTWVSKTPDEILFDINTLFSNIWETTLMKERPNTLLLPPAQWSYIMTTPRTTGTDTTIAQFVANNSPYLNSITDIIALNECTSQMNPELSDDAMVAYDKNPDKLQLEIPVEMQMLPVQQKGLEFMVPCRSRLAGLNIYYPLSIAIATGI